MKCVFHENGYHLDLRSSVAQCVTLADGKCEDDVQVGFRQNVNENRISSLSTVPQVGDGTRVEMITTQGSRSKFSIRSSVQPTPTDWINHSSPV